MANLNLSIGTKKTGAGHFNVNIFDKNSWKDLGSFETTDMQLIDDIHEMNDDGFESELVMFETFEEIINYCVAKLN